MRLVAALALLLPLAGAAGPAAADTALKIAPALEADFAAADGGAAEMLVVLAEQADLAGAARLHGKATRGRWVVERLRATAARTQASVLAELGRSGAPARGFWAANLVWTRGDRALAERLAAHPEVARLEANPWLRLAPPVPGAHGSGGPGLGPLAVEWNIALVNAPAVWALGYTGQGTVLGGADTGYAWSHPALIEHYRGWNGTAADHDYDWCDAIHPANPGDVCGGSIIPFDNYGHGTHTMGTIAGDDGAGNQIGMAPGARWIGCRNMDDAGNGTPATYTECFQWMMAPTDLAGQNPDPALAPHAINNSWICLVSEGCTTPDILRTVVENVRAAGIVVVASAGNSGSSCGSVESPPAIYDAAFTVGATDSGDFIAGFSSRGPVTVDGSNRMKPDIAAPGVDVRSSVPGGGYGGSSGTSMAGPHVAGFVGLLISAKPELAGEVDAIEDVIRGSAVHPPFGGECGAGPGVFPNHTFGWGRFDALAAVNLAYVSLPFLDGFETGDTSRWTAEVP